MGVYGLLAAFCYISLIHIEKNNNITKNAILWTGIITIVYGASDEIHQYFVPNRSSELQDWLADITGVLVMLVIIKYFLMKRFQFFRRIA